jgi:molybdenum-dependent DNA-binding transcriptional regulator ModE
LTSGGTGKGVGELTALGKKELENYKDDEFFKNISKIVSLASKEKN